MGRVLTNSTALLVAIEAALGVQPAAGWKVIEETTIGKYGPTLTKMTRNPISKNRQRRKGALTDLDSSVEFEADVTYDHLKLFAEGLFFSTGKGGTTFTPTAVTATGYTVAAGGNLADGTIIVASGFPDAANNGRKVTAGASTNIEIKTPGLVANAAAPPSGAVVEVAGFVGAAADLQILGGNLKSTAFDFTAGVAADIQVGQFIWIGDDIANAGNNFAQAADRGFARVKAKGVNLLTLDKKSAVFVDDPGAGKTIYVYFGEFIRNVAVDDPDYLEQTYQFELSYPNLGVAGATEYEYAKGNFCNEITFDFQTANKATMKCNFVGTDCAPPTAARAVGADAPLKTIRTEMYNTSSDFIRLRATKYDETGVTTDFKSLSLSIKNNVTAEKVLGTLGGKYMNAGELDVEAEGDVLFTDDSILSAMRNNETLTMEVGVRNDDGGFVLDIPAMTIEGGDKSFPVNQTVTIKMKSVAFQDPTLGTSVSLSVFPYLPAA